MILRVKIATVLRHASRLLMLMLGAIVPLREELFAAGSSPSPRVIYGADNRREVNEPGVDPGMAKYARSTALITFRNQLSATNSPLWKTLTVKSLADAKNLCPDEPFAKQPVGGWCSGFLAAPDLLVTAGHCLPTPARCAEIAVIFDFTLGPEQETLASLPTANVYYCKEIVMQKYQRPRGEDFAVIRLDRLVRDRRPLPIRRYGKVDDSADLTVIGHPLGLPTKVADGAYVRDNTPPHYFVTNADSFGGNSGSAVFSTAGLVEGILVRGERDFEYNGDCLVAYHCSDNDCRGEDATRSTIFAPYIP